MLRILRIGSLGIDALDLESQVCMALGWRLGPRPPYMLSC
jgi:hypothetical protein